MERSETIRHERNGTRYEVKPSNQHVPFFLQGRKRARIEAGSFAADKKRRMAENRGSYVIFGTTLVSRGIFFQRFPPKERHEGKPATSCSKLARIVATPFFISPKGGIMSGGVQCEIRRSFFQDKFVRGFDEEKG